MLSLAELFSQAEGRVGGTMGQIVAAGDCHWALSHRRLSGPHAAGRGASSCSEQRCAAGVAVRRRGADAVPCGARTEACHAGEGERPLSGLGERH